MEGKSTSTDPQNMNLNAKDALKQARRLLSKVSAEKKEDRQSWQSNHPQTSETLGLCFAMASSFHNASMDSLTSADWAVVRAVIELIVRWGISPYLSPGVGIQREKTTREKQAAEAISEYLGVPSSNPSPSQPSSDGTLLLSCNLLLSFAMENLSARGFCVSSVVRDYYLEDTMVGFLQAAYGPSPEGVAEAVLQNRRKIAVSKIDQAMETLSVGEMVETFLALVRQKEPFPPEWLKSEAGKVLSRLVMKNGGVQAVLQRLVGGGVKGNVHVYDNVAAHLAKVPKYVANAEEYYHAVCPQLLPLLPSYKFAKSEPGEGETAHQILRNIHHTSLLLACTMIVREPELSETYLLKSILEPLIKWCKLQSQGAWFDKLQNEGEELQPTETLLVGNLMRVHALLTAGHKDTNTVRKLLLQKTRHIVPFLMILHYLLETSPKSEPFWADAQRSKRGLGLDKTKQDDKKVHNEREEKGKNKVRQKDASSNEKRDKGMGLTRGFLDAYVSEKSDEDEDQSTVGRLKAALTDLMIAHVDELPEDSTHVLLGFLSDMDVKSLIWPTRVGDIWNALSPSSPRLHTPAEYLSRLLLDSENWSLVVMLMGDILRKVIKLHQSLNMMQRFCEEEIGETSQLNSVLQVLQSFEIVNEIVGSKALECDSLAASTLVQDLLNEPSLLNNADMVELVLHMVHNVLNGFSSRFSEQGVDEQGKNILMRISTSLERICSSSSVTERVKRMSSTLNTSIFPLMSL